MSHDRSTLLTGALALVIGSFFLLGYFYAPLGLGFGIGAAAVGAWTLRPWSPEARGVRRENAQFRSTLDDVDRALAAFDARHGAQDVDR